MSQGTLIANAAGTKSWRSLMSAVATRPKWRWRGCVTVPAPRSIDAARKLEQFADNLACLTLRLDASQVGRLDGASAIELGFPHDFFAKDMVRAMVCTGHRDRIDAKLP